MSEEELCKNLTKLSREVDGSQIANFMQDTLDALFNIFIAHPYGHECDVAVFDAIVSL